MIVEDQSEVIQFLMSPDAWGQGGAVERIDTHISVIFLKGARAIKLKRAVRLPYLDFSTPERRRAFCDAEVTINRRTAPDIYRGVLAVTREKSGRLRLGGGGEPVDWVVDMARFDENTLFDRLAVNGVLDRFAMEELADAVARFHGEAERRPTAGGADAVARTIASNAACFAECPAGILDPADVEGLREASERALSRVAGLLDSRRVSGFVRHCHGDLHLRNIFLHRGQATLFDAIEFSAALSDIDVLYDVAFLVMDVDHRGLRRLASILLNRYLDVTGDAAGLAAFPLFLSIRAAIRSHVTALAAASQADASQAEELAGEARRYLAAALAYLLPDRPRLIAVGGLSGSGKSRLARDLAPHFGAAPGARIVRTDCTRKRLAGVPLGSRLGPDGYSREMTERTYAALLDECARVLAAGQSVIADAVFAEPGEREEVERVAREAGVPFTGLWLDAQPQVMEERVSRRRKNASDATPYVVRMQLQYDLGEITWQRLDTTEERDAVTAQALNLLAAQGAVSQSA